MVAPNRLDLLENPYAMLIALCILLPLVEFGQPSKKGIIQVESLYIDMVVCRMAVRWTAGRMAAGPRRKKQVSVSSNIEAVVT